MQGDDVDLDLLGLGVGVELPEAAEGAEARVDAQAGDRAAAVAQDAEQLGAARGVGEVGRLGGCLPQLAGELVEALRAAGP